jgi:hypothetical protein
MQNLTRVMPRAFVFSYDGYAGGCTRIRFQPDPGFSPATYEQRILQALVGTVLIKEPDDRVCGLDASVSHKRAYRGQNAWFQKHFSLPR